MKTTFRLFLIIFAILILVPVWAQDTMVLKAGVSIEEVPKMIFGSWNVKAGIVESSNYKLFKPKSVDLWNISRRGNVLNLSNPFTGASADVSLNAAQGNVVSFTRVVDYDNKKLTDVVTIRLEKNTFSGINDIKLEQISSIDGEVMKSDTARYELKGEKISGGDVLD